MGVWGFLRGLRLCSNYTRLKVAGHLSEGFTAFAAIKADGNVMAEIPQLSLNVYLRRWWNVLAIYNYLRGYGLWWQFLRGRWMCVWERDGDLWNLCGFCGRQSRRQCSDVGWGQLWWRFLSGYLTIVGGHRPYYLICIGSISMSGVDIKRSMLLQDRVMNGGSWNIGNIRITWDSVTVVTQCMRMLWRFIGCKPRHMTQDALLLNLCHSQCQICANEE